MSDKDNAIKKATDIAAGAIIAGVAVVNMNAIVTGEPLPSIATDLAAGAAAVVLKTKAANE